jgi:transposase
MATSNQVYVGIDVAKEKLDIAALGESKASQVQNNEEGIERL